MAKIKVGVLSFSDGRQSVHEGLAPYIAEVEQQIRTALLKTGEIEFTGPVRVIAGNAQAKAYALEVKSELPDAVISKFLCDCSQCAESTDIGDFKHQWRTSRAWRPSGSLQYDQAVWLPL